MAKVRKSIDEKIKELQAQKKEMEKMEKITPKIAQKVLAIIGKDKAELFLKDDNVTIKLSEEFNGDN